MTTSVAALPILTPEDHAEIRANALRLFRGKSLTREVDYIRKKDKYCSCDTRLKYTVKINRARCKHGIAPICCVFCTRPQKTTIVRLSKPSKIKLVKDHRLNFVGADVSVPTTPGRVFETRITSRDIDLNRGVPDVSGGFRWNDLRLHRPKKTPEIIKPPKFTITDDDLVSTFMPPLPPHHVSYNTLIVPKMPRKSVKDIDNKKRRSYSVTNKFTGEKEYIDPAFAPICESRVYGGYARIPIDDLEQAATKDIKLWNAILGMPNEPNLGYKVIRREKSHVNDRRHEHGAATPNSDLKGLWLTRPEKPVNAAEVTNILNVYFHGASPEDVRDDSEAAWLYQVALDPQTLNELSETEKHQLRRRFQSMEAISRGVCPTGTCPDNLCANLNLSFVDRREIHALRLNTAKGKTNKRYIGRWYCVVRLDRDRIKWLPDVSQFPGETEAERIWAAFQALIDKEMDAAEKQARQLGQDPEQARQARKEAFSRASLSQSPKAVAFNRLKD